jgi:misacylated tRNA(Ala) deacylase
MASELLFRQDAYARDCEATVAEVNERGGIVLDRTVFYASAGGQPGDRGALEIGGRTIPIAATVYGEDKRSVVHVPADPGDLPQPGERVRALLDWELRHRHMRAHTALHLLCSRVPFPVTGGQIGPDGGRPDFDIDDPDAVGKERLSEEINRLIAEDHPVGERWITDEEMDRRPELVRTMAVKPPRGSGKVRLVMIGEDGAVDLQPCGGTHVRSTGEIGRIEVDKIEKKGKLNRRIRLILA